MTEKKAKRIILYSLISLVLASFSISSNIEAKGLGLNNVPTYQVSKIIDNGSLVSVESFDNFESAKTRMNQLHTSTNPHVVTTEVKTTDGILFGDFNGKDGVTLGEISRARYFYLTKDKNLISDENFQTAGFKKQPIDNNPDGQYTVTLGNISQMRKNYLDGNTYTKILAQPKGGYAQSYPYRAGTVNSAAPGVTITIFGNKNLTNNIGYIPAHYQMELYDVMAQGNSFIAEVGISGQKGYVDISKIDLMPLAYYSDINGAGGKKLTLGGYEQYYQQPEASYTLVPKPEFYKVEKSGNYNEITFYQARTGYNAKGELLSSASPTFGIAPDWMKPGIYYSRDDIKYFTDMSKTKPVMDGNSQGEYYSYFQWLPLNTKSLHTAQTFKDRLTTLKKHDSAYLNLTEEFVKNGNLYGMNSLLIYAQANLESGYGTSGYAKLRNNLFGQNAVDSNPNNASYFESVGHSIKDQMSYYLQRYMNPAQNFLNNGFSFGNMSSGVSYRYASDPLYGMKIASIAYAADKEMKFLDYNNYQLVKLRDLNKTNFTDNPSNNGLIYTSKSALNIIVTNIEKSGNYYKTHRSTSPDGEKGLINFSKDYAYYLINGTVDIKSFGPKPNIIEFKSEVELFNDEPLSKIPNTDEFESTIDIELVDKENLISIESTDNTEVIDKTE